MVGISDYEHIDGFGLSTWEQVSELNKALAAGYDIPATSGGISGSALRVESLESSLKVITFQMQHIKFWQKVPKLPAFSTVEEYNQLRSYGGDGGAFSGSAAAAAESVAAAEAGKGKEEQKGAGGAAEGEGGEGPGKKRQRTMADVVVSLFSRFLLFGGGGFVCVCPYIFYRRLT